MKTRIYATLAAKGLISGRANATSSFKWRFSLHEIYTSIPLNYLIKWTFPKSTSRTFVHFSYDIGNTTLVQWAFGWTPYSLDEYCIFSNIVQRLNVFQRTMATLWIRLYAPSFLSHSPIFTHQELAYSGWKQSTSSIITKELVFSDEVSHFTACFHLYGPFFSDRWIKTTITTKSYPVKDHCFAVTDTMRSHKSCFRFCEIGRVIPGCCQVLFSLVFLFKPIYTGWSRIKIQMIYL